MTTPAGDDLKSVQTICDNTADAALNLLIGLGPRPTETGAAAVWDTHDALLKNKVSSLTNLSSSIGATIVVEAISDVWPELEKLDAVTTTALGQIAKIADVNKGLTVAATVITFATAAIAVVSQPTLGNAGRLVTAFNGVKAQLAA